MLLENPLSNPMFLPTLLRVGGLLVAIFVALVLIARFDFSRLREGVLFQRWRVWATIAPIFGIGVLSGELAIAVLVAVVVFIGLREYSNFADFTADLGTSLNGATTARSMFARGKYDAETNVFTAYKIGVYLLEP